MKPVGIHSVSDPSQISIPLNSGAIASAKQTSFDSITILHALNAKAAIFICLTLLSISGYISKRDLPRNALWEVVNNLCVRGQSLLQFPKPCLQVDLHAGIENGFAVLSDPRGGVQFLLVPTSQISGVESPIIRGPGALNYFGMAWDQRSYVEAALHASLRRDDIGLAINSAVSRSQDQLHIHISCVRQDVSEVLHENDGKISGHWTLFNFSSIEHHYLAMWISGENLSPHNPFNIVEASFSGAAAEMADRTIVVIGFTKADKTKGFVILTEQVDKLSGDLANGEDLLDPSCNIVAIEDWAHRNMK